MTIQRSKALGYTYEVAVQEYLSEPFPNVKRNGNLYGPKDRGDLSGVPGWTLQLKNVKTDKWAEWFKKTANQAVNGKTRWWAVVRKARNKAIGESLFVMKLEHARDLMAHLRDLENRIREYENAAN